MHSRHSFATEMVRLGVSLPALMQMLGHKDIRMTMRYVEVVQLDLQREFHRARQNPLVLHSIPQLPLPSSTAGLERVDLARLRTGLDGVIDSLLVAQHVLEMFRRSLPKGPSRECLERLSNRVTKILSQARNLPKP